MAEEAAEQPTELPVCRPKQSRTASGVSPVLRETVTESESLPGALKTVAEVVLAPICNQSISLHFGEAVQLLDGQQPLLTVECSDGERMGVWKQTVLQRHVCPNNDGLRAGV